MSRIFVFFKILIVQLNVLLLPDFMSQEYINIDYGEPATCECLKDKNPFTKDYGICLKIIQ